MRKILLIVLLFGITASYAQVSTYKKRPTLSINFIGNDFRSAQLIKQQSLSTVLRDKTFSSLSQLKYGLGIGYHQGLSSHIDFMSTLNASLLKYPFKNMPAATSDKVLLEADANVNIKLLTDHYTVVPYLTTGVGVSMFSNKFGAYIPFGTGLQFNLGQETFLFTQAQYRVGITDLTNEHFVFSLGFGVPLKDKKEEMLPPPPPPTPEPVDTDGDGILDINDKCPTVKGVIKYDGCPVPDTDNDGINDDNDACPTVTGVEKYKGCPVPDTDKDGINDDVDACPTVAGAARYKGCPIPDTDKDGVNDEEDECIDRPGPVSNKGCPLPPKPEIIQAVNKAATRIYFQTGSAKLLPKSFTALNEVVKILKDDNILGLDIEGHTDNVGTDEFNQKLSEDRAKSVYTYFTGKGVGTDRIISKGFGESQPKADNKTAAGRAQNRRVVMQVKTL